MGVRNERCNTTDRLLTISFAQNHSMNYCTPEQMSVHEFYERLSESRDLGYTVAEWNALSKANKNALKNGPCFIAGKLENDHRKAANLLWRDVITLDYDDGLPSVQALLDVVNDLGYSYLLYSTANFTPDNPRVRLCIPTSRPVESGEYQTLVRKLIDMFGFKCDDSSAKISQLMYMPSHLSDVEPVLQKREDAPLLDVDFLLYAITDYRVCTLVSKISKWVYAKMPAQEIVDRVRDANAELCVDPLSDKELESMVLPAVYRWTGDVPPDESDRISEIRDKLKTLHPENNPLYMTNDTGAGRLFADVFRDSARFCAEHKLWYVYDGMHWAPDLENLETQILCCQLADALNQYTTTIANAGSKESYAKFASCWYKRRFQCTIIEAARAVYPIRLADFDTDPYLLNCKNGVLDLRTGKLKKHSPDDLLSHLANVEFNPDATYERWSAFMLEICCGDAEQVNYIQKVCGYALSGDTRMEKCWLLHGPTTRNGKSTLVSTIASMLGDYAGNLNPKSVTQHTGGDGNAATESIARMVGRRFVTVSEPSNTMTIDASLVKTLTGNDLITARFLYGNSFEFRPIFKLVFNANSHPTVTDSTLFTSGRMVAIPFNRYFAEDERDLTLKDTLSKPDSLSGILNWCLAGWQQLQADAFRLIAPAAVQESTDDYNASFNHTKNYIDDHLVRAAGTECDLNDIYHDYEVWAAGEDIRPLTPRLFKKDMLSCGVEMRRKRPNGAPSTTNARWMVLMYTLKN